MSHEKTVFKNEEAVRLLNYFCTYKEIICKTDSQSSASVQTGTYAAEAESDKILIE